MSADSAAAQRVFDPLRSGVAELWRVGVSEFVLHGHQRNNTGMETRDLMHGIPLSPFPCLWVQGRNAQAFHFGKSFLSAESQRLHHSITPHRLIRSLSWG